MAPKKPHKPTPEQLALAEARRLKKERLAAQTISAVPGSERQSTMRQRDWLEVQQSTTKREVDFCVKEVDRLEKIKPLLTKAGYKHQYGAGPNKKHGCMIAYTSDFAQLDHRIIQYDNEDVRVADTERACRGSSFKTRNIGLLCIHTKEPGEAERSATVKRLNLGFRQAAILKREVNRFRTDVGRPDWPCVVQEALISPSLVVHKSIDPAVPPTGLEVAKEGEKGESTDPDRVITDARSAVEDDGLLSVPEFLETFQSQAPWCSVYDDGLSRIKSQFPNIKTFGDRVNIATTRKGAHEPEWTSYTHYWKTVLASRKGLNIHGVLKPFATEELQPGLPRKGVSSSDHMSSAPSSLVETIDIIAH
ncbi:Endonuclease/exonuclease/phosphatase [Salix suchowensis]|nr:Endonuclease/exonuclease/phosphatase [Salix suchowensis]